MHAQSIWLHFGEIAAPRPLGMGFGFITSEEIVARMFCPRWSPNSRSTGAQALLQKLQVEQRLMKRRLERQHASSVRPSPPYCQNAGAHSTAC